MSILLFFLVLFVLILVHEWGHYIAAKKTGMRVDEFGIGFPPKLFGRKWGETEFTFNIFPIGGFVKIWGEDSESAHDGGDFSRSFIAKPKWAQAVVLVAGVTMNVIFAWLLYIVIFMMGVPGVVDEATATDTAQLVITEVLPGSPADEAGLSPGSIVKLVTAGTATPATLTPSALSSFVSEQNEVVVQYTKGSAELVATVTPQTGVIAGDMDRPAIGVAFALFEIVQEPFLKAVQEATVTTVETTGAIVVGLSTLIVDSIRGTADFSQVAGPVGIVGLVGDAAEFGFTSLLLFTAVISLNLAVINLLPFPALDGGRLLFVLVEKLSGRAIDPVWVMRLNTVGFLLLIGLMIAVTYNDILRIT